MLCEVRFDETWGNSVDADIVFPVFAGQVSRYLVFGDFGDSVSP